MQGICKNKTGYIEINNITFSYTQEGTVLNNISVSFSKGQFVAIIGPNGSGKTTLGKIMTGILSPDKGEVLVDGENITDIGLGTIAKKIGYLFQQPERQLFTPKVKEEIAFVYSFMGRTQDFIDKKANRMIEAFDLEGLEEASPYRISRGERQRVALAAVLINDPLFLVLDEPTIGLDIVRKKKLAKILQGLQNKGIGMAVISHDKDFVEKYADRVIKISGGEVIET